MLGNAIGSIWLVLVLGFFAVVGGIGVIKSELGKIRRIMLLQLALQVDPDLMLDASSADKVVRNAARTALELDAEASERAKLFMKNIQILAS